LDGEIGLTLGDDFFRGISVLDDEVAGVARHHYGLRRALRSLADFDHIGDLNEMILYSLATVETGGAGRFDDGLEIPVIRVAENLGEVPTGPEFVTRRVGAADGFKGCDFVAHNSGGGAVVRKSRTTEISSNSPPSKMCLMCLLMAPLALPNSSVSCIWLSQAVCSSIRTSSLVRLSSLW